MTVVSKRVARRMRQDVFDKLMRLPVSYFDRYQAGDIISRVSYDIDVISTCMATDIVQILSSVVTVAGSLVMMVSISLPLSALTLVTVPVSVVYTVWMRRRTQPRYAKRSKSYGVMNGFVEEMLSGQKTILAYAYENRVDERFSEINRNAADAFSDAEHYGVTIGPTMTAINNLGLSLIVPERANRPGPDLLLCAVQPEIRRADQRRGGDLQRTVLRPGCFRARVLPAG